MAGEMNNVPAINCGMEGSLFSCVVRRRRDELVRGEAGGGGVGSGGGLYALFPTLLRLQLTTLLGRNRLGGRKEMRRSLGVFADRDL